MFVISPALVWQGEPLDIFLAALSAAGGVWIGTAVFMGYLVRTMPALVRLGFLAAAVALMIPAPAFDGAGWVEIGGGILAAILISNEYSNKKKRKNIRYFHDRVCRSAF